MSWSGIEGVEPHYQIVVEREGNLDTMQVQVEVSEEIFSDEVRILENLAKRIQAEIKDLLGRHLHGETGRAEDDPAQRGQGPAGHRQT